MDPARIEDTVISIITDTFSIQDASVVVYNRNDLESIGLDSINYVLLIIELEERLNIQFSIENIEYRRFLTVDSIAENVRSLISNEKH